MSEDDQGDDHQGDVEPPETASPMSPEQHAAVICRQRASTIRALRCGFYFGRELPPC